MTREGSCSVRPEYALILGAATHDAGLAYLESIRRPESLALSGLRGSCTVVQWHCSDGEQTPRSVAQVSKALEQG